MVHAIPTFVQIIILGSQKFIFVQHFNSLAINKIIP